MIIQQQIILRRYTCKTDQKKKCCNFTLSLTFFNQRHEMKVHFSKYHGTGNDFIMIDGRELDLSRFTNSLIEKMCNRHLGIGADGLIILSPSSVADFKMDFFNSDGYPGSMCGNGGRCLVSYANKIGVINQVCSFEAPDGMHTASILVDGTVRLKLNNVNGIEQMEDGIFLDTGSPHFVVFRLYIDDIDVVTEGRKLRNDPRFAGGTNVNFVELTENGIKVRTYERGVENETLSCGTGVTAAAIASYYSGLKKELKIDVSTKGGNLQVEFEEPVGEKVGGLYLSGPAVEVFRGTLSVKR